MQAGPLLVIAGHPHCMTSSGSMRGCWVLMMLATAATAEYKASLPFGVPGGWDGDGDVQGVKNITTSRFGY